MKQPHYRLEVKKSGSDKSEYYLVKDVRVRDAKGKVVKYVGSVEPDPQLVEELSVKHASEIEMKAVEKKAEMSSRFYQTDVLPYDQARSAIAAFEQVKFLVLAFREVLTTKEAELYEEGLEVDYVHGSTSIEGNTISRQDTRKLLVEGTLPADKNLREINEVQNFKNVAKYRNKYRGMVSIEFIRKLHALIMNNIDIENAGVFRRTDDIGIYGRDFLVTPSLMIEEELRAAINRYYSRINAGQHPFVEAILFHHTFERIHPFIDGNGRVGREVLNYMLMEAKYPRLLFVKDRATYLKALSLGDDDKPGAMVLTMADLMIHQRADVAEKNLRNLSNLAKKEGQTRLIDFGP